MIEVDGSMGEGGGQILRTALSLAGVLTKDVGIFNIRAGRTEPGLRPQHLTSVMAAAELCSAEVSGGSVGSTELVFKPLGVKAGRFRFDVGTAGSVTLVLQTLGPLLAFAPGRVELVLSGGTDVKWSPPTDYVRHVLLPSLERVGFQCDLQLVRRGHYPRGGGLVNVISRPSKTITPVTWVNPGPLLRIRGVSHAVGLPRHVAERQSDSARKTLVVNNLPEPETLIDYSEANSAGPGSGMVLFAETQVGAVLGADCLGERGKPAEKVGSEPALQLVEELGSGAFLDRHMGDMIIPYLALADGFSEVTVSRITEHTLTNIKIAELLAGVKFQVEEVPSAMGRIGVKGLGITNSSFSSPREFSAALRP